MSLQWTAEQILALAPDSNSQRSGQELASSRKWLTVGCDEQAAWGEMQGSAKAPYQTQIDLSEPAFRCSCPSRKFPCKHALGLFLLWAQGPEAFDQKTPPAWVSEWLAGRAQRAEARDNGDAPGPGAPREAVAAGPGMEPKLPVRGKRAAVGRGKRGSSKLSREQRVAGGTADLDLWLKDLVRHGLANAQAQPVSFWEGPAARLVDAQAPGLARKLRSLSVLPAAEGWQERLLDQAARLYLLVEAYGRIETLPPDLQSEVRSQIGWTQNQEELLQQDGLCDCWLVVGQTVEEDFIGAVNNSARLRTQRTWLWGQACRQGALLLQFAPPGQALEPGLVPGTAVEAELVYYAGAYPLRALVKQRLAPPVPLLGLPGYPNWQAALAAYAAALGRNPWIERFPVAVEGVIPARSASGWYGRDREKQALPLAPDFPQPWRLLAFSGGHPLDLFGEWDGDFLHPLSAWDGERWAAMGRGVSVI